MSYIKALPSGLLVLHVLCFVVASVGLPARVKRVWENISSPFRNFLALDDLFDPVDLQRYDTTVRKRFLILLSCIQAACWGGSIGFALYLSDFESVTLDAVYFASWVSNPLTLPERTSVQMLRLRAT